MSARLVLLVSLLVASCQKPEPGTECEGCNVVLITIDALRPDHLGLYGYVRDTSPRLDELAERSTVYDVAISPAPCTRPAVLQMLTGSLPHLPRQPRLAEILKAQGFRTGAVVSHHFFRGHKRPRSVYARGFERFNVQSKYRDDHPRMTARTATEVTHGALSWMGRHANERFFLWLHYFDPHDPYDPPPAYRRFGPAKDRLAKGDRRTRQLAARKPDEAYQATGHIFSPAEVATLIALYDAEIRYVDAEIGRLLDALEDLGLSERTIVFVTADHGERLGEDNLWDHCFSMHGLELDVPLMVSVGGKALGGHQRWGGAVTTLDILPTVLDLGRVAKKAWPANLDGRSLVGSPPARRVSAVWQDRWVIQDRAWKLYVPRRGPLELYRIDQDPDEKINLANREPAMRRALLEEIRAQSAGHQGLQKQTERIIEELQAIGYIQ